MSNLIFLRGGPAHGKWVEVDHWLPEYRVLVPPYLHAHDYADDEPGLVKTYTAVYIPKGQPEPRPGGFECVYEFAGMEG